MAILVLNSRLILEPEPNLILLAGISSFPLLP
jgi:hypothetical protein